MQWYEIDLIVEALEEHHPELEIEELTTAELYELILDLPEFSDDPDSKEERTLKKIMETWQELRQE